MAIVRHGATYSDIDCVTTDGVAFTITRYPASRALTVYVHPHDDRKHWAWVGATVRVHVRDNGWVVGVYDHDTQGWQRYLSVNRQTADAIAAFTS